MANTLRELILCASPLTSDSTVREHLLATDCENLGTGSGSCTDIPVIIETSDIPINITEAEQVIVELEAEDVGIVISDISIGVSISQEEITTKIEEC